MITLSERLQLELRNRDPSEITELILDNSKANEIEGLDDSYVNLRELSLVNVGLTSLQGFPSLPNLEKLDLSDNKLSFGLDNLCRCPQLMQLLLTNNRIKSFKDVENLAILKNLEILDLFNCAISSEENYRKEIFALIPTLKYLDGFDEKNEEELNESEEYDEEEEEENEEGQSEGNKDVYELSDDSGSDEEYESEEEVEIVNDNGNCSSGKASNTRGKDMNLYPDDVVEITDDDDEEEDDEDDDNDIIINNNNNGNDDNNDCEVADNNNNNNNNEEEEEVEYDAEESYDEDDNNTYGNEIIETNGKNNYCSNIRNEYDEVLLSDNDEDSTISLTTTTTTNKKDEDIQENSVSLQNGGLLLKRNYETAFNKDYTIDNDNKEEEEEEIEESNPSEVVVTKQLKSIPDFEELTDDSSSLLDKV